MSRKKFFSVVLSILVALPAFLGLFCFGADSAYAAPETERLKIVSVTSLGQPQSKQKHRSSGNFSTEGIPNGFSKLYWEVSGTKEPDSLKFNIKRDKSAGKDPIVFSDLKNKSVTGKEEIRSLYVADPKGSYGGDFIVTVYATN